MTHNIDRDAATHPDRRNFLKVAGTLSGVVALGGLPGCGGGQSTGKSGEDLIKIPDTGAELPSGKVTFRWLDSNDAKVAFWDKFWPKYEKAHSNIKVQYDGMPWPKIQEVLPLGLRNSSAHDVFALPGVFSPGEAVARGWVAPLDDAVPGFEAWKKAFPPTTFLPGIHVFEGKTYTFPVASNRRHSTILLHSTELVERAGYDWTEKPPTWSEYREACRKITKAGNGRAYGLAMPAQGLHVWVRRFCHGAGGAVYTDRNDVFDAKTGEYAYTMDEYVAAVELFLAIQRDGSVLPGSAQMVGQEAWNRIPRGQAGTLFGGPWVVAKWEQQGAKGFGVAAQPTPDAGNGLPLANSPADLGNSAWIYAESELKEVAGDVFAYIGSVEGQKAWGSLAGVSNPSVFEEALEFMRGRASAAGKAALDLGEQMLLQPSIHVANDQIWRVLAEQKPIEPNVQKTLEQLYVGEAKDVKKALQQLKDRSEKARDGAIAAARKKGVEVSHDDWVFANWDATKDYTKKDYESR